ncbi:MAG: TlpA family protein disulfide reductase [Bacteroidales bacterium]|nr:TlpA family protein disulfide reductase [Bacteroidales bacterium]
MKRILILAAALAAVLACRQLPAETTLLTGKFDNKLPDEVHILAGQIDTLVKTDPETHTFRVELPTDLLSMASIDSEDHGAMVILDGTPLTIEFGDEGQAVIRSDKPKISVQERYNAFGDWLEKFMDQYQEDRDGVEMDENLDDAAKEAKCAELFDAAYGRLKEKTLSAIRENNDNVIALMLLPTVNLSDEELSGVIDGLAPVLQEHDAVKSVKEALAVRSESGEGKPFKDFTVVQDPEHPEETTARLSDYVGKGKYVLVDFWASWCGPCRAEMPNLRSVYEKYHGDDFDMLSVAVWDQPEATKVAAEEEGIVWNQIINAQHIPTELYGIEGIPHIILFGPDGTVLKRDLRGEAIGAALESYLGK